MPSFDKTWVGYAPAPANDDGARRPDTETAEDRTAVEVFRKRPADATVVQRLGPDGVSYVADQTESSTFTNGMVEELRRRLREAEAREEGSGVRERPTPIPEEGTARGGLPSTPVSEVAGSDMAVSEVAVSEVAPILDGAPLADVEIDVEVEIEVEVEDPRTVDELDEVLSALPELEVSVAPNSESNFYAGFDDEHPDGIFFATYQTIRPEAPVYVTVHLPAGYRFRTPAIVEWVREPEAAEVGMPAGVGLKMCGLDARMRHLIRSFAKHRKPLFYVG